MELIQIIISPTKVFELIKNKALKWSILLIIMTILVVAFSLLNIPIKNEIMLKSDIATRVSSDQLAMIQNLQSKMQYINLIASAVQFLIKMAFFSLLLWGGVRLFRNNVKYVQIFSLFICAYFIIVLGDYFNTLINYIAGIEHINVRYNIYKIGINVLFDVNKIGVFLYTFLYYINPFQIWFLLLVTYGLTYVTQIKLKYSFFIILSLWIIAIVSPSLLSVYIAESSMSKIDML